jgi:sirohydrochlorin ferrochelatase
LVEAAVLNGEPSLEQALKVAAGRKLRSLLVYPFFMSDGCIVDQILHRRLANIAPMRISVMRPLGLEPGLPSLLLEESLRSADAARFVPSQTRLLVVGHGSRLAREFAASTARMADSLRRSGIFAAVEPAFLEEEPFLRNELKNETHPTVVAGFFSGEGVHAWRDVPAAIEEAGGGAAYTGPRNSRSHHRCSR